MTEPLDRPVILDATVLSNYAGTDSVTRLAITLEVLQTVPAVAPVYFTHETATAR
jgi:hypothetical protein